MLYLWSTAYCISLLCRNGLLRFSAGIWKVIGSQCTSYKFSTYGNLSIKIPNVSYANLGTCSIECNENSITFWQLSKTSISLRLFQSKWWDENLNRLLNKTQIRLAAHCLPAINLPNNNILSISPQINKNQRDDTSNHLLN